MPEQLSIGEASARVGMSPTTLRYYDEIGLVPPTDRVGNQRRYDERAVRRLRVVDTCKRAGFRLDEVAVLLDGDHAWQPLAREKRAELARRIDALEAARALLADALACDCEHLEDCDRAAPEQMRQPASGSR